MSVCRYQTGVIASCAAIIFSVMFWAPRVFGHQLEATEHRLDIQARENNSYAISWRSSLSELKPILPPDCRAKSFIRDTWALWTCEHSLGGRTIEIKNLLVSKTEVLARVDHGGDQIQVELLSGKRDQFTVRNPEETSPWHVAQTYFVIGVEHIIFGFDHLLFVFGLLLILAGWKKLTLAITAFTVAHSITLALSVLGVIRLPIAPVEAVIALSIVFLASEYARQLRGEQGWTSQKPWLVSFTVGLLHGLGFAGALREVGLPEGEIPLALVMFNVGVEAGQLAFVAVVIPVLYFAVKWFGKDHHRIRLATAYSIGSVAAFWFIERMFA